MDMRELVQDGRIAVYCARRRELHLAAMSFPSGKKGMRRRRRIVMDLDVNIASKQRHELRRIEILLEHNLSAHEILLEFAGDGRTDVLKIKGDVLSNRRRRHH